jgi:hypothetical protein
MRAVRPVRQVLAVADGVERVDVAGGAASWRLPPFPNGAPIVLAIGFSVGVLAHGNVSLGVYLSRHAHIVTADGFIAVVFALKRVFAFRSDWQVHAVANRVEALPSLGRATLGFRPMTFPFPYRAHTRLASGTAPRGRASWYRGGTHAVRRISRAAVPRLALPIPQTAVALLHVPAPPLEVVVFHTFGPAAHRLGGVLVVPQGG